MRPESNHQPIMRHACHMGEAIRCGRQISQTGVHIAEEGESKIIFSQKENKRTNHQNVQYVRLPDSFVKRSLDHLVDCGRRSPEVNLTYELLHDFLRLCPSQLLLRSVLGSFPENRKIHFYLLGQLFKRILQLIFDVVRSSIQQVEDLGRASLKCIPAYIIQEFTEDRLSIGERRLQD